MSGADVRRAVARVGPVGDRLAMRLSLILSAVLALAACGGSSKPTPTPPGPPQGDPSAVAECGLAEPGAAPANAEQCECLGHQVVGDIGNGQVACPDGTTEVARIAYGIEGGVCCAAAGAPAAE